MIKSVTVINSLGEKIKMSLSEPWNSGLVIKSIDGLGPVKADINTSKYATIDGSKFNSAKISERNIVFDLIFYGVDIEAIRLKTYKYFPVKDKIKIIFELDYHEVYIEGYVENNDPDIFSKQEGNQVSIICPDPFFKGDSISTSNNNVTPLFEFPFSNPSLTDYLIEFGMIDESKKMSILYDGNVENGVEIDVKITGNVSNLIIYKENTNMVISINTSKLSGIIGDGSDKFQKYDYIRILTYKGKKTAILIRDGVTYNIIGCLPLFVKWIEVNRGINYFLYKADVGENNVEIDILTQNLYNGI